MTLKIKTLKIIYKIQKLSIKKFQMILKIIN